MEKTIPYCPTNWLKETKKLNTFSAVFYHICLILQLKLVKMIPKNKQNKQVNKQKTQKETSKQGWI